MNDDVGSMRNEDLVSHFEILPSIFFELLKRAMKIFTQHSRLKGRVSKAGLPEFETGSPMPTTQL